MFKLSSIPQSDLCFRILKVEVCDEVLLSIDSKTLLHQGSQAKEIVLSWCSGLDFGLQFIIYYNNDMCTIKTGLMTENQSD